MDLLVVSVILVAVMAVVSIVAVGVIATKIVAHRDDTMADLLSQFAYQLCTDEQSQVDLAKTMHGIGEAELRRNPYFRVPSQDESMYPMSGTEDSPA